MHRACIPLNIRIKHPWDAPMANDEHVALLKKDVEAWNEWRDANPDVRPDFSGADLVIVCLARHRAARTTTAR